MSHDDFAMFETLRRHGVPFVIVGGHAVNYHGHRRATEDADVVWLRTPQSERALAAALAELNAQYITREIDPATGIERALPVNASFVAANRLMMLWVPDLGFLDLFDYVPGEPGSDVAELFRTSVEAEGYRYASLAWLRRMKRQAGRSKDLQDLEELDRLNADSPDGTRPG